MSQISSENNQQAMDRFNRIRDAQWVHDLSIIPVYHKKPIGVKIVSITKPKLSMWGWLIKTIKGERNKNG